MSRRRTPRLVRVALLVVLTYFTLCGLAGVWLGSAALHTPHRAIDASSVRAAQALAERQDAGLRTAAVTAQDGAPLRGWLFMPRHANGDAVIVLHGVSDTRVGMLGIAEMLVAAGYAVLTPDARAHGDSGGALATYGLLERGDLQHWVQWLRTQGTSGCVHGVGVSMGAAQLLQALDPPAGFCSAVAESPFVSFREIALDRLTQRAGTDHWLARALLRPVVDIGLIAIRLRYGLDLAAASPIAAVAASPTPVLLIQGDADTNIAPRHARALRAANPERVTLWMVGGARHAAVSAMAADAYRERLLLFLAAQDGRLATGL